jgi:ribosome biogenesis GTPase
MFKIIEKTMTNNIFEKPLSLSELSWKPFFQQQLTLDEYEGVICGRIISHQRSGYLVATEIGEFHLATHHHQPHMTVGDWILVNEAQAFIRLLERKTLFSRKAPGSKVEEQLIAANIDTVFIVCSLNNDFNLSRIERYLTLVNEAQADAVIVLTKADLCDDVEDKRQQVQALDPMLMIETVNSLDINMLSGLKSWCKTGQTVAFMGSSGVGKSTLINSLLENEAQLTAGVREDDSKGRHTTTSRSIHKIENAGLLLDTPGMRELQLAGSEEGLAETFGDIEKLIEQCRFNNCQHGNEPGCAVRVSLDKNELDPRRLENYLKLQKEQARNSASLAEKRTTDKQFAKLCRSAISEKSNHKNRR